MVVICNYSVFVNISNVGAGYTFTLIIQPMNIIIQYCAKDIKILKEFSSIGELLIFQLWFLAKLIIFLSWRIFNPISLYWKNVSVFI